jgi:integrase
VRSVVSSQHAGPPNFLQGARGEDVALLNEWRLVLRGDGKSPKTVESYLDSVRQLSMFLSVGGFPQLASASTEHLREWFAALRDRGNKPSTVHTRYRGARAFYQWLLDEGELRENPVDRISPPRIPETVQPYYTPEEIALVLRALTASRGGIAADPTPASYSRQRRWRPGCLPGDADLLMGGTRDTLIGCS